MEEPWWYWWFGGIGGGVVIGGAVRIASRGLVGWCMVVLGGACFQWVDPGEIAELLGRGTVFAILRTAPGSPAYHLPGFVRTRSKLDKLVGIPPSNDAVYREFHSELEAYAYARGAGFAGAKLTQLS